MSIVRFFWTATRGSRLMPWRSPYLRWRMETYTGKKADQIGLSDFVDLAWNEKGQMLRFTRWIHAMERDARPRS